MADAEELSLHWSWLGQAEAIGDIPDWKLSGETQVLLLKPGSIKFLVLAGVSAARGPSHPEQAGGRQFPVSALKRPPDHRGTRASASGRSSSGWPLGAAKNVPPESGQHSSMQTFLIYGDKNQSPWVSKESKALLNQMINCSF